MIEGYNGGPVGIRTLAANIGEDMETIESLYEPYLLQKWFYFTYATRTNGYG